MFALKACVETSGNPYAVALAHHKEKGYDPAAFDSLRAACRADGPAVPVIIDVPLLFAPVFRA